MTWLKLDLIGHSSKILKFLRLTMYLGLCSDIFTVSALKMVEFQKIEKFVKERLNFKRLNNSILNFSSL